MSLLSSRWRCGQYPCLSSIDKGRPEGHQTGPQRGLHYLWFSFLFLWTWISINSCFCLYRPIRIWGNVLMTPWWNFHSLVQQSNKLAICCTIGNCKLLRYYYCCHTPMKYYCYWLDLLHRFSTSTLVIVWLQYICSNRRSASVVPLGEQFDLDPSGWTGGFWWGWYPSIFLHPPPPQTAELAPEAHKPPSSPQIQGHLRLFSTEAGKAQIKPTGTAGTDVTGLG